MSVLMILRVSGDPAKLEQLAACDPAAMRAVADDAQAAGCVSHRFYGSENGEIMVLDEWESAEAFQRFFASQNGKIQPMMEEVGAGRAAGDLLAQARQPRRVLNGNSTSGGDPRPAPSLASLTATGSTR